MNWEVWQEKKGVQGLQAFAFCVVTVNDEPLFQRYGSKLK